MLKVRVRDKNQITLPMAIVRAAHIKEDDILAVQYSDGVISFVTAVNTKPIVKDASSVLDEYIGCAKGMWGETEAEITEYFRNERQSWER